MIYKTGLKSFSSSSNCGTGHLSAHVRKCVIKLSLGLLTVQLKLVTHVIQRYPVRVVQPQGGVATVLRDKYWCIVHFLNPIKYIPHAFPKSLKKVKRFKELNEIFNKLPIS